VHDHVYKVIEIVGSSEAGVDDAIRTAIARASETIRHIRWFEVVETRGHVEAGAVRHFQVTLKIGFTLDEGGAGAEAADVAQMRVAAGAEPGAEPLHEGP
jgi:dodecin